MDVLEKLELLRDLPIGAPFPPEMQIDGNENWALSIKALCWEAAAEIQVLRLKLGLPIVRSSEAAEAYDQAIAAREAMEGL